MNSLRGQFKILLLCLGMFAFLLNHTLDSLYNANGYLLGSIFIVAGFCLSRKRRVYSVRFIVVLAIMLSSCLLHFLLGYIATGFFESFLCYVGFPIIAYLISNEEWEQDAIIKFVALTGVISFAGTIFYYINFLYDVGVFRPIFTPEITITYGALQLKNTSIYGSSLIAGVLSLVQASCCAYLLKKGYPRIWWFVFFLCVVTLIASLSRRAFVPLMIVIFYLIRDWNLVKKGKFYASMLFLFGVLAFMSPDLFVNIFNRFTSIFDMGSTFDGGNQSRLNAIWFGFNQIFNNPFGTGFGSLSSIGKETKDLWAANDIQGFLGVTESFYLTLIGELGLVQSLMIFTIFIGKYHLIFDDLRLRMIFLPLCLEATLGLGLLNPIISLFSLMCILPKIRSKKPGNFYGVPMLIK
jgi:hypothetical protein